MVPLVEPGRPELEPFQFRARSLSEALGPGCAGPVGTHMTTIDFSKPAIQQLHRVLTNAYNRDDLLVALVQRADIEPADIPFKSTIRDTWQALLIAADLALKVDAILDAVLADPKAAKAHGEVRAFRAGQMSVPAPQPAPSLDRPSEATERLAFEKIMSDQPTFLDIMFLQAGLDAADAVVRLRMKLSGRWYLGTGFLIAPDLVLTNHHNLFDEQGNKALELEVQFDYETTLDGAMREPVLAKADLTSITGERDGDWAIVRLVSPVSDRTPLQLASGRVEVNTWVAIIQHPDGLPKKIAMHHNTVTYADANIVHYLTDTLGGSSGSPVFNERWEVVALHHAGGDRELPGTNTTVFRNEGIAIGKVRARLDALGIRYGTSTTGSATETAHAAH